MRLTRTPAGRSTLNSVTVGPATQPTSLGHDSEAFERLLETGRRYCRPARRRKRGPSWSSSTRPAGPPAAARNRPPGRGPPPGAWSSADGFEEAAGELSDLSCLRPSLRVSVCGASPPPSSVEAARLPISFSDPAQLRRTTGLARSTLCILGARPDVRCTRLHNLAGRGHHGNLRARRALHAGVRRSRQHVVVRIVGDKRPTGVLYAFDQLRHRKPYDHEPGQDYPDHDDARHRLPEQADSNPCDAGAQIAASRGELVRQEQPVDGIGRGFGRRRGPAGRARRRRSSQGPQPRAPVRVRGRNARGSWLR